MALASGSKLGPYEIQSPLGAGGMGEVYRARDTRLDRDVAIKVLPADLASDAVLRQRLEREARAVSRLSHPHICTLHDVGQQEGVFYLVMEGLRTRQGPMAGVGSQAVVNLVCGRSWSCLRIPRYSSKRPKKC